MDRPTTIVLDCKGQLVLVSATDVGLDLTVTTTESVEEHPLLSVTVTV